MRVHRSEPQRRVRYMRAWDRWDDLRDRAEPFGFIVTVRVVRGETSPTVVQLIEEASGQTAAYRIGPVRRLDLMLDQIQREFFERVWARACARMYGDGENVAVH